VTGFDKNIETLQHQTTQLVNCFVIQ